MKHEKKEWYTCDRCGEKIEEIPSNVIQSWRNIIRRRLLKPSELHTLTADKAGYISKTELLSPDVVSAEIVEYYNMKRNEIHLCGKCRKEFERFMRNEPIF